MPKFPDGKPEEERIWKVKIWFRIAAHPPSLVEKNKKDNTLLMGGDGGRFHLQTFISTLGKDESKKTMVIQSRGQYDWAGFPNIFWWNA